MTVNWDLFGPMVITTIMALGQISVTRSERKTGQVVWWASLPFVWPRIDYTVPSKFRQRQWLNILASGAFVLIALFVSLKFFGL